jgi:plasmid stabilization system protein ParE
MPTMNGFPARGPSCVRGGPGRPARLRHDQRVHPRSDPPRRGPPGPARPAARYAGEVDLPGLRARPVEQFPYLIFYLEHTDHIDVLRIPHARRDIPTSQQDPAAGSRHPSEPASGHMRLTDRPTRQRSRCRHAFHKLRCDRVVGPVATRVGSTSRSHGGSARWRRARHRAARGADGPI